MKVSKLIQKLVDFEKENPGSEVCDFLDSNSGNEYLHDDFADFEEDEDGQTETLPRSEVFQYASDRLMARSLSGESADDIFANSTIYIYGSETGHCIETVLAEGMSARGGGGRLKFDTKTIKAGSAVMYEIVSNDDIFCFTGGSIGSYPHSMTTLTTNIFEDTRLKIDFSFKVVK